MKRHTTAIVAAIGCLLGAMTMAETRACTTIVEADDVRRLCRIITDPSACPPGAKCYTCDFYGVCTAIIDNTRHQGYGNGNNDTDGGGSGEWRQAWRRWRCFGRRSVDRQRL